MSLFKAREWWSTDLKEIEMFDSQNLLIASLPGEKFQSIFLGNHKGILRIFSPNSDSSQEGHLTYEPSHLLLEVQLAHPILQINEGALVSGSPNMYLGVLHPRLFSVYTVKKAKSQGTDIGVQMEIELVYQHNLRHSAHSFILGPFGGIRGRSFICIQSLDGLLSFYEQESFAFQLYLPTFLLPFTFAYIEKTDSFLFLNGSLILDCYSYEGLASSANANEKKLSKSWEFNLGEGILDINVIKKDGSYVVVLSERNLFVLNENGKMIFMRRLDSKPVAFCSHLTKENKTLLIVLATEGGFVNFYEETDLKWSMKIDQIPVTIKRIYLNDLPGGLVLLSEDGYLQIVYIGTHPSVYLVPPFLQPDIDLQKAGKELNEIQQKIEQNDMIEPLGADLLRLSLKVDKKMIFQEGKKTCNTMLEINPQCEISKIQVLFLVEPPLVVANQSIIISNCSDRVFVENSVTVNGLGVVSSLDVRVIATYKTSEGMTRVLQANGVLPLELIVSEAAVVKETTHKITLTTNKPVCSVNELFRGFASNDTLANAMGFQFPSGAVVSILAAKSSQKYRLQADSLTPISILLQSLLEKLKTLFPKDFSVSYSGSLPLEYFFEVLENHQELIKEKKLLESELLRQTSQYITIQKKVLANLKDVMPRCKTLHKFLSDTYQTVKRSINKLENIEEKLIVSISTIRSISRLMMTLLELMFVQTEDLNILKIVLNPNVQEAENQGWLEVQEAAINYFLRTVLAKSTKDQQKPNLILLEPITDITKLKKHITSAIERVTKGTYLLERNDYEEKKEPVTTIQAAYESDEGLVDDTVLTTLKLLEGNSSNQKPQQKLDIHKDTSIANQRKDVGKSDTELVKNQTGYSQEFSSELRPITEDVENEEINEAENDDDDDDGIWDFKLNEMRI